MADPWLIIDAMDLIHEGRVGGLCIVSSDSDFTRLAVRARRSGLLVLGMGEAKAPQAYRSVCDEFVLLGPGPAPKDGVRRDGDSPSAESVAPATEAEPVGKEPKEKTPAQKKNGGNGTKANNAKKTPSKKAVRKAVLAIIAKGPDSEVPLAYLGSRLSQSCPGFDVADFGHKKLSGFLADSGYVKLGSRGGTCFARTA